MIVSKANEGTIKTGDPINPQHYKKGGIEPIDFIESNDLNFNEGNVVKYVTRHRWKNGLEDLLKARFYLQREIEKYERAKQCTR